MGHIPQSGWFSTSADPRLASSICVSAHQRRRQLCYTVKALSGHAQIATTERYSHLTIDSMLSASCRVSALSMVQCRNRGPSATRHGPQARVTNWKLWKPYGPGRPWGCQEIFRVSGWRVGVKTPRTDLAHCGGPGCGERDLGGLRVGPDAPSGTGVSRVAPLPARPGPPLLGCPAPPPAPPGKHVRITPGTR